MANPSSTLTSELRFKYRVKESQKYNKDLAIPKMIINELIPNFSNNWIKERDEMLSHYRLYNNDIDQEVFESVCNPLGISTEFYDEEVLPYNKTYQKIDVLLGEEYKRGFTYTLALLNPRAVDHKDQELKLMYKQYINEVVEKDVELAQAKANGASVQEIEELKEQKLQARTPQQIEDMQFLSELEILGNDIMNYGIHAEDMRAKKNDAFKHALLSDREFIYVGVEKGDPRVKVMNPITIFFDKNPETKYIQDGDWAGSRTVQSVQRILEMYGDEMNPDDRRKFEERVPGISNPPFTGKLEVGREHTLTNRYLSKLHLNDEFIRDNIGSYSDTASAEDYSVFNDYEVVTHVEWKWLREMYFHTFINEYGDEQVEVLDSGYPIPEDHTVVKFTNQWYEQSKRYEWVDEEGQPHSIEKLWIPRRWEGIRIGDDIFVRVREVPFQYIDMDNPYKCKLGYHGLIFNSMNAKPISMMGRMKPFQFLFFVVLHQIKELIPKHIGPIQNFDTSMIDPNLSGIDNEGEADKFTDPLGKTLFYRKKGLNVYNSMINNFGGQAIPTQVSRPQPGSVQNMSVAQDLGNLLELLGWIDVQIGMAAGVSPQREAQFSSNTNVSDNQQAIVQSSYITEHYFRKHNDLWKEVMESYINYARMAWQGRNMKKQFVSQEGALRTLDISEDIDFDIANWGLFVTDSGRHEEYLNKMEELALTFMQNDGSMEQVSYILKARSNGASPEEVHKEIVSMQRASEQRQAQMQEAQDKLMLQAKREEIANREDIQASEMDKINLKGQWDYRIEQLKQSGKETEAPDTTEDDAFKQQQHSDKMQLEYDKLAQKDKKDSKDAELKEKAIQVQRIKKTSSE